MSLDKETIVDLMRSEKFCTARFLGANEDLDERIEKDKKELESHGISKKQICDVLKSALKVYSKEYNKKPGHMKLFNSSIKGDFVFHLDGSMFLGSQRCPYDMNENQTCNNERFTCAHYIRIVKYKRMNFDEPLEIFSFGSLNIHLIEEHDFFEGKHLAYRLCPRKIIKFFGLEPGVDVENFFENSDKPLHTVYDPIPNIFYFAAGCAGLTYST